MCIILRVGVTPHEPRNDPTADMVTITGFPFECEKSSVLLARFWVEVRSKFQFTRPILEGKGKSFRVHLEIFKTIAVFFHGDRNKNTVGRQSCGFFLTGHPQKTLLLRVFFTGTSSKSELVAGFIYGDILYQIVVQVLHFPCVVPASLPLLTAALPLGRCGVFVGFIGKVPSTWLEHNERRAFRSKRARENRGVRCFLIR